MASVIEDITSSEFAAALDSNLAAYWSAYGRAAGCTLRASPEVAWFYTGIPTPLFNGVVYANLRVESVAGVVADLQAEIDRWGAPAFWWIGPRSRPAGLSAVLERSGLQPAGEVPGMAVELATLPAQAETIPDLAVQRVDGPEMQALWARIAALGTGFDDAAVAALARVEASLADPQYLAQPRYIGYLQGAPVATSALVLDAGVAGIYAVATLPAVRGRGIGRLMTLIPLLEARQMGYQVGILQSSDMGYPIYRKLGFRDVCKYELYLQS